jgi:hypothetical protein
VDVLACVAVYVCLPVSVCVCWGEGGITSVCDHEHFSEAGLFADVVHVHACSASISFTRIARGKSIG